MGVKCWWWTLDENGCQMTIAVLVPYLATLEADAEEEQAQTVGGYDLCYAEEEEEEEL